MANQNGRNGSSEKGPNDKRDDKDSWRNRPDMHGGVRREDDERYRMRRDDADERFEGGQGSHWEDRERGYGDAERRGMGQSGYGAGRSADDRSLGIQTRNTAWSGAHNDRGTDDRWTGRGSQSWSDEHGERDYGRGTWEEGRIGMSQGYGYQDGDRPSFERGMHDSRFGSGSREQRGNAGGPYGGGGYEPDPRSFGSREQNRQGPMGYGQHPSGYGQHQTGFGGAQGLDVKRGPHRGKGPKGFEVSDERVRERVCEALTDDHNIDATNIEVSVHKGEVTLTGTVEDRESKRMAEDCVLQCSGVRDVHNQLRISR